MGEGSMGLLQIWRNATVMAAQRGLQIGSRGWGPWQGQHAMHLSACLGIGYKSGSHWTVFKIRGSWNPPLPSELLSLSPYDAKHNLQHHLWLLLWGRMWQKTQWHIQSHPPQGTKCSEPATCSLGRKVIWLPYFKVEFWVPVTWVRTFYADHL